MKKKTYFRIQLLEGANSLCNTLVLLAAQTNGGAKKITLPMLKNVADSETILYPSLNINTSAELIGDNLLHIDTKVGESYKTVCVIEEVEIMELGKVVEMGGEDDIPDGIFTATNGHGGLAD